MRKPDFCTCENKSPFKMRSNPPPHTHTHTNTHLSKTPEDRFSHNVAHIKEGLRMSKLHRHVFMMQNNFYSLLLGISNKSKQTTKAHLSHCNCHVYILGICI